MKSAIGVFSFSGELGLGESFKMMPPGPFGTAWKDFPKNLIVVGIPVDHELVMSSSVASGDCFCCF